MQGQWGSGQRQSGGGGASKGGATDWREVVRTDRSVAERPRWLLTCYGHEREGPNDLVGDISPEEVRWANLLSGQRGATQAQLAAEFKAAEHVRVEQFQALARAVRPPSKGGAPLPPPSPPGISSLDWIAGAPPPGGFGGAVQAAPFGQPAAAAAAAAAPFGGGAAAVPFGAAPAFGAHPPPAAAAQSTGLFGQAPQQTMFGQAAQQPPQHPATGGFGSAFGGGSAAVGGFGGVFGSAQAAKPAFGQAQASAFGSTPFGSGASSTGGFGGGATGAGGFNSSAPFGAAAVAAAPSGFGGAGPSAHMPFGQQPSAAFGQPSTLAPTGFPSPAAGSGPGAGAGAGPGESDPEAEVAWRAAAFVKGRIPEHAPPPMFCQG
jgi:hypothetical protein